MITPDLLSMCMPHATKARVNKFVGHLSAAMEKYEIDTPERVAAFLAQIAHESGSLRYVREIHDGSNYEGRKDLGNTIPGDGKRFRGRGLIQLTGRSNYQDLSEALDYDFIEDPEALEKPGAASYSAAWFWKTRGLNELADRNDFKRITRIINGGYNGLEDRLKHWETCKKSLNILEP